MDEVTGGQILAYSRIGIIFNKNKINNENKIMTIFLSL